MLTMSTRHRLLSLLSLLAAQVQGQDSLGLNNGSTSFTVGTLEGSINNSSQTLISLSSSPTKFDFLPSDFLPRLAFNGAHHLGDITLRYRSGESGPWTNVDSASARKPVTSLEAGANTFAAADMGPTLPAGLPLKITREWLQDGVEFAMRFNITNTANASIELGSLGIPVSINNIFTGRSAENTQDRCSLADPYIGLDAGYVRVTHLKGTGNVLVVTPLGSTPFEAWRFLREPNGNFGYQSQTFEGNYEWQVHSLAYAQNEWTASEPWNTPTSKILNAGEQYTVGLKFSLADDVQHIEDAVVKAGVPVAVGIPGFVIPSGSSARLFLEHSSPVRSIDAGGALEISEQNSPEAAYKLTPAPSAWGRARVTITYDDGKIQTVHYFIPKAAPSSLADLGKFFTTTAHFTDTSDPFNRAPSIMNYDREENEILVQERRVWFAGLSDEAGSGAYLAAAMKQFIQPVAEEVEILDEFVHETMVGTLQPNGGFGVIASAFFYQPNAVDFAYNPSFDWSSWTSWNRERSYTTRRAYNYIHPTATYWSLYRTARSYPDQKLREDWSWYLGRAVNTTLYCLGNEAANCDYGLVGLMGEWVLGELLSDLKREAMTAEATALETAMRFRANLWETQAVPFGSEMAWDSTGQEGVYYWTQYFKLATTPAKTINSILAYMPSVAHWGWNGNARRYWDFVYGAKIAQIERQLHHYGSGLNSLPMLHSYEQNHTDNLYALRVGFAGNAAPLTNIDEGGFASAAFHSFPELLRWDPYVGDYGQGFLGLSLGQCVYVVADDVYGDLVFGGDVDEQKSSGGVITVAPRDAVRRRVFIAELRLKIEISAGAIGKFVFDRDAQSVVMTLVPAATDEALQAKSAVVWLKQSGQETASYTVADATASRGGWEVDVTAAGSQVTIAMS